MSLVSKKCERQKRYHFSSSSSIKHCQLINILARGSFVPYTTNTNWYRASCIGWKWFCIYARTPMRRPKRSQDLKWMSLPALYTQSSQMCWESGGSPCYIPRKLISTNVLQTCILLHGGRFLAASASDSNNFTPLSGNVWPSSGTSEM